MPPEFRRSGALCTGAAAGSSQPTHPKMLNTSAGMSSSSTMSSRPSSEIAMDSTGFNPADLDDASPKRRKQPTSAIQ